jgi:metallophosphoesterase (TIGR00282 family)
MPPMLRLLFIGDVVGPAAATAVQTVVPTLRQELQLDAVIVNGENSAESGFGISAPEAATLLTVADFVTLGDHAFDQQDVGTLLNQEARIIRPANVGTEQPGRGWGLFTAADVSIGVVTLQGQVFMRPVPESPFAAVDRAIPALAEAGARIIVVEMHCEATSEKQAMGWHCAGRVAAVLGTHTHTPTADERLLPGGTAYLTDVGMTGGDDSIIGFAREGFLRFMANGERSGIQPRPATTSLRLDAALIEVDIASGRALSIERISRHLRAAAGEPA